MSTMIFNASVIVSEQLNRLIINAAQELAQRAVTECGLKYDFDSEEAIRMLGLNYVKVERKVVDKGVKVVKEKASKQAFPLPYNGECVIDKCCALRQNSGLYTQCQSSPKKNNEYCKQCQLNADNNNGMPEYGTIKMRNAVGILEYVDPKGRKPVSYTKVMKKYKIDQGAVMEEAAKFGMNVNAEHFLVASSEKKKGRPAAADKIIKEKGSKGRPKKEKKVLQIEGDDDDLFASLVADANSNVVVEPAKKRGKSEEDEAKKQQEKAEKEAKRLQEKEDKLAALALEKEIKIATEKAIRELKKAKDEEEKLMKKIALEEAKKAKEDKLAAKKSSKPVAAAAPTNEEEEADVVKKIEFEGKKYLKSKKTGIIYDYVEYTQNGEQVIVGHWNETKNQIDFNKASEEEEEEDYDM